MSKKANINSRKFLQCPHVNNPDDSTVDFIKLKKKAKRCHDCDYSGPNLWICLQPNCLRVGCSEQAKDHSTKHFQENRDHCVHINISSQRSWCYVCEHEVFVGDKITTQTHFIDAVNPNEPNRNENCDISHILTTGLVGLQNIANTCYMNSALQALSNIQPLTYYLLNCGDLVDHILNQCAHKSKAGLAKSYQRLIKDIWCNVDGRKEYIAPRSILYGIRTVHPMFRGYQQHDTQEFLRCFMDQLHEELKEQQPQKRKVESINVNDVNEEAPSTSSSVSHSESISDSEYESCDGGIELSGQQYFYVNQLNPFNELHNDPSKIFYTQQRSKLNNDLPQQTALRSIISDIFDGKLLSSVQCLTCDRVSSREETFQDLSLPIPNRDYLNVLHTANIQGLNSIDSGSTDNNDNWISWIWNLFRSWLWGPSVTLYDCMASFFSADELKGDNMYSCEKCNKLRTGIKYSQIMELPEVICIHLKRFRHDLSYSSKISSHVQFPLEGFDMRSYLHKECKSTISIYNLVSVICHHGTVGGGHYTCFAKNFSTNNWYEYDDHNVTLVSAEIVQNSQAYVLFYQKCNPQMNLIRSEASEMADMNPVDFVNIRFYISREWLSRFNTFAEPGPIDNWAILCPHGGLLHSKSELLGQIAVAISQPLWDFLFSKFGGGPVINVLFECEVCKRAIEALARRQYYELNVFTKYNELDINLGQIYAISMPWLRKWQQFARGITSNEPGPISNNNIVLNDQSQKTLFKIRPGSDYAQLNAPLWRFLQGIYGGGPEIILRQSTNDQKGINEDFIDEQNYLNTNTIDHTDCVGQEYMPMISNKMSFKSPSIKENSIDRKIYFPQATGKERTHKFYTTKMKPSSLRSLRRKTIKNRKAVRKAELFGANGTFLLSKNSDMADNIIQRLSNDFNDGVSIKSGEHSQNSFQNEKNDNTHMKSKTPGYPTDFIVSKRKQKKISKNKEKVILQKYCKMRFVGEAATDV